MWKFPVRGSGCSSSEWGAGGCLRLRASLQQAQLHSPSQPFLFFLTASSPNWIYFSSLVKQRSFTGALVQPFPQSRVSPFLALIDIRSVSDHKEQVKPMSLKPQSQIYRQKENSVIFFHVFVVTGKIDLLFSVWRHFYCSPFMSLGVWSHSRSELGPGLSAKYYLYWKLSALGIPTGSTASHGFTGTNQSGTSS